MGTPESYDALQSINDHQQQQSNPQLPHQSPLNPPAQSLSDPGLPSAGRKKGPSVRRACAACHAGKTRCSEVLPCQSCLKRGLGATCAYPEPDGTDHNSQSQSMVTGQSMGQFASPVPYPQMHPNIPQQQQPPPQYYDYNTFAGTSTSTFRPNKRPRNLTEEEAAAITRNWTRGDFFIGSSGPVRIDPRLPVRLTLGENDHVHFTIGEAFM